MRAADCGTIKTVKCVLYALVSTKDKGHDHENQFRELREFVSQKKAEGWVVEGEYVDKASGKNSERPTSGRSQLPGARSPTGVVAVRRPPKKQKARPAYDMAIGGYRWHVLPTEPDARNLLHSDVTDISRNVAKLRR